MESGLMNERERWRKCGGRLEIDNNSRYCYSVQKENDTFCKIVHEWVNNLINLFETAYFLKSYTFSNYTYDHVISSNV